MIHHTLEQMITQNATALAQGPIAVVIVEDDVEVDTTLRHHLQLGFATVIALMPDGIALADDVAADVARVQHDPHKADATPNAINRLIQASVGQWMFYCYNAEYLFFPFCETRNIKELLTFHGEERRNAMLTYVVDLYAQDLVAFPNAVSLEHAHLDRSGYYALARAEHGEAPKERQLDFFGGLRWRFEEHVPADRRRIDRIAVFRAQQGLQITPDHRFNDEEYNTYACPWHHNVTATLCSFRTAKALRRNPGSRAEIKNMMWHNSAPFEWHSRQLLDLGLMEPGQWF